jgi:hypothetical protein
MLLVLTKLRMDYWKGGNRQNIGFLNLFLLISLFKVLYNIFTTIIKNYTCLNYEVYWTFQMLQSMGSFSLCNYLNSVLIEWAAKSNLNTYLNMSPLMYVVPSWWNVLSLGSIYGGVLVIFRNSKKSLQL